MDFKVIVLGGGIIGTSTAYYLTKLGAGVTLIEGRDIAAGTSGSCDRAIMLQSKTPGPTLDLAMDSARMYQDLEDELDADLEYRMSGGMIVIDSPEDMEAMKSLVLRQRRAGLDVKLLSGDEARLRQPGLSPTILGSTWWPSDAEVNPLHVSFAMARAAARQSAEFRLHTKVAALLTEGHRVTGVQTTTGERIYADAVIAALGVWTPKLLEPLGLTVPIIPRRGQILVSERLPTFLECNVLSSAYIAAKMNKSQTASDATGVGLSIGQTGSGTLLIGGSREFAGFDVSTTPEVTRAIAQRAVRAFPHLAKMRVIRTFAGLRPYTPDGKPILSAVRQWDGLYVAAGHEGDGIALAPITGKIAASLACGLNSGVDITPFALERFEQDTMREAGVR